jgi:hypothetical protein
MSEKYKLYKNIEAFIDNNCAFQKNEPFIINFLNEKENPPALPQVRDTSNFIQCIMNIPKEKEDLLKDIQNPNGLKINIIDSSFEFILYKNNTTPSVIKCLLLLIINDLEKVEAPEEETKNEKTLLDINSEYKLLEKLKKFIFNYIKKNKKSKKSSQNDGTSNDLEYILLGGAKNDIRFFNQDNNGINYENENIKKIIEIIKSISSKLEIKQKKNQNEKSENKKNEDTGEGKETKPKTKKESDKVINDVLDELNPNYKTELIYRYLDEMPEEIVGLMKKYKNINFTKNMYMEYLEKNKGITNGEEIENKNEEERMDEELF